MTIIRATTTISVLRDPDAAGTDVVDRLGDSYTDSDISPTTQGQRVVYSGVRANIGSPSGSEQVVGGNQENIGYRMQCDIVSLFPTDQIRDERSGLIYDVVTSVARTGFRGREYTQATLSRSRGAA